MNKNNAFRLNNLVLVMILLLAACRSNAAQQTEALLPTPANLATQAPPTSQATRHTPTATVKKGAVKGTLTPTPMPADTIFAPTETVEAQPTATSTTVITTSLPDALLKIVQSDAWAGLGIEAEQKAAWENFAQTGSGIPSPDEQGYIQDFVTQWDVLNAAAGEQIVPSDAQVVYRVSTFAHQGGSPQPVLYAAVGNSKAPNGQEQLFLIARDRKNEPVGLEAAPLMDGMFQRIRQDGQYIEYVDSGKKNVLLFADARKLAPGRQSEEVLMQMMGDLFSNNDAYMESSIFPRYYFPVEGVNSQFFTFETLMTYNQILQMNDAFQLLDRPDFAPLKNAIFNKDISVTIIKGSNVFLGRTYLGTGVMQLNRQDLLGNKYWLVSVLSHEGTHTLQTLPTGGDQCKNGLRREVGDMTIPQDFFNWDANQVLDAIPSMNIGAYHVGFWVLAKLGLLDRYVPDWRSILQTGKISGQWVANGCQ